MNYTPEQIAAILQVLRGYYLKLNNNRTYTAEDVMAMIEDDFKTLREWDGERILNNIKNIDQ